MAASEPSSLALHPPLIKTTVPATEDLTSEEQVPGWALGAHVITIVTSGSGLILATQREWWRLPLEEDKTRTIGFRSIISLTVRTTCSLLSTCWIVREGWDNASFLVCDLRNNDDSVDKNVPAGGGAGMAQRWEHSPPTNVARVGFPDPASNVGWVCWFSSLHREVCPGTPVSPLLKNHHLTLLLIWVYSVPN